MPETAKSQRGNKMQKQFEMMFDVYTYDDGTLDACVLISNKLTNRTHVLRYDAELRDSFETEDDFLSSAFDDFAEQIAGYLQFSTDF